jgi:hypothetical protein
VVGAVVILISLKSGKDCKEICSHLDRWTFQPGIKQNSPSQGSAVRMALTVKWA